VRIIEAKRRALILLFDMPKQLRLEFKPDHGTIFAASDGSRGRFYFALFLRTFEAAFFLTATLG
jgi:hypothetical protein